MDTTPTFRQRIHEMLMESQFWPQEQMLEFQRSQLAQLLRHARATVPNDKTCLDPVFRKMARLMGTAGKIFSSLPAPICSQCWQIRWQAWISLQFDKLPKWLVCMNDSIFSWKKTLRNVDRKPILAATAVAWVPAPSTFVTTWAREEKCALLPNSIDSRLSWCPAKNSSSCRIGSIAPQAALKLDAILGHGTGITEEEKDDCQRAFGAHVIGLYSSTECHKVAHPCPSTGQYHVNAEIALVEIVGKNDCACALSTPGRVIITPFLNTAQPLIHNQGDTAIAGEKCSCGGSLPILERIIGRTAQLFRMPDGRRLSPSVPPLLKWQLGTDNWQIAQVGPLAFEIRYIELKPAKPDAKDQIIQNMRSQLGKSIEVRFVKLDTLPFTASGKFMKNVCKLSM